jgi:WD40 repeat protein
VNPDGHRRTQPDGPAVCRVPDILEGHTDDVTGLALSFDATLLASSSDDNTIKLWAFESRQLLASFDVQNPRALILSHDSRKLAYTTYTEGTQVMEKSKDHRFCICDTPPDILARAQARVRKPINIHFPCANIYFIHLQTIVRKKPALALSNQLNVRV